jgi:hypothetical protein
MIGVGGEPVDIDPANTPIPNPFPARGKGLLPEALAALALHG